MVERRGRKGKESEERTEGKERTGGGRKRKGRKREGNERKIGKREIKKNGNEKHLKIVKVAEVLPCQY